MTLNVFRRHTLALLLIIGLSSPAPAFENLQSVSVSEDVIRSAELQRARLHDPWSEDQLKQIVLRLKFSSQVSEHTDLILIQDPSINAFAVPGGLIGLHTGVVAKARSEDELAGVLAHELAHVVYDHHEARMNDAKTNSLIALLGLVGAAAVGGASQQAAEALVIGSQGLALERSLGYSRMQETDADMGAVKFMSAAGYNTKALVSFFQTLLAGTSDLNQPPLFITHPMPQTRLSAIQSRVQSQTSKDSDALGFKLLKSRLLSLTHDSNLPTANTLLSSSDPADKLYAVMILAAKGDHIQALKQLQALKTNFRLQPHAELLVVIEAESLWALKQYQAGAAKLSGALAVYPESRALMELYIKFENALGRSVAFNYHSREASEQLWLWKLKHLQNMQEKNTVDTLQSTAEIQFWQGNTNQALLSLKRAYDLGTAEQQQVIQERLKQISQRR